MGIDDQLLGELTKKFGIDGGQAKSALDKILPFVKGKLPGMGGGNVGLLSQIKSMDLLHGVPEEEKEAHVQEVAKHSGLDVDTVRKMLPEVADFLKK
jgi:uncharacterized protein YidB (DUF937 family)